MKIAPYKCAIVVSVASILSGLCGLRTTSAYFDGIATPVGNTFTAGILDFTLTPEPSGPADASLHFGSGTTTSRIIDFALVPSSIGTSYSVKITHIAGDMAFCNQIEIKTVLNGTQAASGNLSGFTSDTTTNNATTTDVWEFDFTVSPNVSVPNSVCSFDLEYDGRQANLYSAPGGFSAAETVHNTLYSEDSHSTPDSTAATTTTPETATP